MRIVFDSNVLLSAFGTRGICEALFALALESHQLFTSEYILSEVAEHLSAKFKAPKNRVSEIVAFLRQQCEIVAPAEVAKDECRDADDLAVLGTALASNADVLATGDRDLLALKKIQQAAIITPRALYNQLLNQRD